MEQGRGKGLCARGGFVIDMKWDQNKLLEAKISSEKGGKCSLLYNGNYQEISLKAEEKISVNF